MANLFSDFIGSFDDPNTYANIGSSTLMGGAAGGPAGAAAGATLAIFGAAATQRAKRKAARRARAATAQAKAEATANRNRLVEENFARRSRQSGMGSLSPGQEGASRAGTSLLASAQTTQGTSLFEGVN